MIDIDTLHNRLESALQTIAALASGRPAAPVPTAGTPPAVQAPFDPANLSPGDVRTLNLRELKDVIASGPLGNRR